MVKGKRRRKKKKEKEEGKRRRKKKKMMVRRRGCFGREAYDCFRERKMRAGAVFLEE